MSNKALDQMMFIRSIGPPQTVDMVYEFHEKFNHITNLDPTIPDKKYTDLRVGLLQEELDELKTAIEAGDIVAVFDALTDLQYVLDGAYLIFGLAALKSIGFAEVHDSNMSKLGADGKPVYREDGKIMKGPNYRPPNLKQYVDRYLEIRREQRAE